MTENEFLQLKIGTVVSNKWKKNTHFMIYDTDQMGTAYRGKKYIVMAPDKWITTKILQE